MKRIISLFLCMCVCTLFPAAALADIEFDISVFENNPIYTVDFDDMNDSGEITPAEVYTFLAILEDDEEGLLIGSVDIKIVESFPPVVRLTLLYRGEDWIFTDKVIIKAGNIRYTFEVDRDTEAEDGKIYESLTLILTDANISLLENILTAAEEDLTSIRIRLDGDRDVDGYLLLTEDMLTSLKNLNDDYIASGALNNDFSAFYESFPCSIKDLSPSTTNQP